MGFIGELISKFKQKGEKEKLLEEDLSIQERVQEKTKSANERELERYVNENRERQIENKLKGLRQRQSNDLWKSNILGKNRVRGHINDCMLKDKSNFLRGGRWQ